MRTDPFEALNQDASQSAFQSGSGANPGGVGLGKILRRVGLACLVLWLFAGLGPVVYDWSPYTCAVCRADKVDYRLVALRWTRHTDSDLSLWYEKNVESSHTHSWITMGRCRPFGIPFLWTGFACTTRGPLAGLSQSLQREIYEHFEDPLEAKQLFIELGDMTGNVYRRWAPLMEWVDEGYPGRWSDWWERHGDDGP